MIRNPKPNTYRNQQGFIQAIIIIIIALIILRLLGLNILDILNNPSVREFIIWFKELVKGAWIDFLTIFDFVKEV